jgi:hypothetical protein
VAREVNQLLGRVFAQRRKDGRTDLEAVESAMRATLHYAGGAVLSELLQFAAPAEDQRQVPCRCGHSAHFQEMRSKAVLTILGPERICRPYYLCSNCREGQFPLDVELDIERTEFSSGVRRMQALVAHTPLGVVGREGGSIEEGFLASECRVLCFGKGTPDTGGSGCGGEKRLFVGVGAWE